MGLPARLPQRSPDNVDPGERLHDLTRAFAEDSGKQQQ
jgi:hypothetical protein